VESFCHVSHRSHSHFFSNGLAPSPAPSACRFFGWFHAPFSKPSPQWRPLPRAPMRLPPSPPVCVTRATHGRRGREGEGIPRLLPASRWDGGGNGVPSWDPSLVLRSRKRLPQPRRFPLPRCVGRLGCASDRLLGLFCWEWSSAFFLCALGPFFHQPSFIYPSVKSPRPPPPPARSGILLSVGEVQEGRGVYQPPPSSSLFAGSR